MTILSRCLYNRPESHDGLLHHALLQPVIIHIGQRGHRRAPDYEEKVLVKTTAGTMDVLPLRGDATVQ